MQNTNLLTIEYPPAKITEKRESVRQKLISRSPNINGGHIERISNLDLEMLFQLYDTAFLKEYYQKFFPGRIRFSLSTRMTRSAGKTNYPRNLATLPAEQQEYEIRMGINFFFNYNQLQRDKTVNGIKTRDGLDALQLVFEHEIVHLVELHCCRESSCRKKRFKGLAYNIFAHTESYHELPTEKEIACTRYGFNVGDQVCFNYNGIEHRGFINSINKRATVLVPDPGGLFQDQRGKRYNKWYITIPSLRKI